ncbi:hypothetical protein ACGFR6_11445 [Streptomyces sp. NPDC048567]|uniref:hypothetical protein n=1 Tax=unclassified Streptomyces TaxID=2593676 RepID=UPI001370A11B|nr:MULTISPECIES: hypothetical protein [unclassified Streptomyces]MYW10192.1 hypothetical protein [Streptomyces sp. SID2563]WUD00897.1 hypothetical protein OHS17_15155 [Streptomyces sp. NBC_00523]
MNAINKLTNRAAVSLTMVLAVLADRVEQGAKDPDRGDVSITTVIIWVAAVTGALLIAGTIATVISRYNGKLAGI